MSIFHQGKNFLDLPPVIGPAGSIPQDDMVQGKKTVAKLKKKAAKGIDISAAENNPPAPVGAQQNITSKSKTSIQVITHLTSDTPSPAILLQTAKGDRHFFGRFGEGLQRALNQNRLKFSHVKNLFISGPLTWNSVGGLPGIILTLADQGVSKISLQAAVENLSWACSTWRSFIFRSDLGFNINNAEKNMYYDEFICVKGVAVYPDALTPEEFHSKAVALAEIAEKSTEIFNQTFRNQRNAEGSRKKRLEGTGSDLAAISSLTLPMTENDPRVSCYIIQVRPTRGKFLPQKAISLGVPAGVMFSKLTNGESVTTPEGNVVKPQDVLEPSNVNSRVLVIDCPSEKYVNNIVTRNDWNQSLYPEKAASETTATIDIAEGYSEPVSVAYHILGKDVNPFEGKYFEWLTAADSPVFKNDCMHFITHPEYAPDGISFDSAALLNMRLRTAFPENFRQLYTADPAKKFPQPSTNGHKIYPMISQGTVSLEPRIMYQSNFEKCGGKIDWESLEGNLDDGNNVKLQDLDSEIEPHLRDIEVVTLGTGSAIPNKYRNVISTLVTIPSTTPRSILFDCGEATLGNMRRLYGPKELKQRVQQIGILYISHLHADHHLGAISFMNQWLDYNKDQPDKTLYVMGPWKYFDFLEEWSQLEPEINLGRLRFVDNEGFIIGNGFMRNPNAAKPLKERKIWDKELKRDLGLVSIKTCKAIHCELAYCVTFRYSMDLEDGDKSSAKNKAFTVSYSGDTRPTDFFAYKVGTGSDLLIHEATHENGLEKEAYKKRHSTISEAVGIAYKMKAKYTVLTHFSQRYPKLPNMAGLDYDGQADNAGDACDSGTCTHQASIAGKIEEQPGSNLDKATQNEELFGEKENSKSKSADDYTINQHGKRSRSKTPESSQNQVQPLVTLQRNSGTSPAKSPTGSPGKYPKPPIQIPPGQMPKFALAFDGLHLKLADIPKQKYKFAELKKMFDEVEEIEVKEEEAEELKEKAQALDQKNGKCKKKRITKELS